MLVLLLLAGGGTAFAGDLMGRSPLHGFDFVMLGLLPLALVVLATWVARTAVLSTLAAGDMIVRFASLVALLYALGFILFAVTLGKPAPKARRGPTRRS